MDLEAAWTAGRFEEGLDWCVRRLKRVRNPGASCQRYALEFALELGRESALLSQFPNLAQSGSPEVQALYSQVCWRRGQFEPALEIAQRANGQHPSFLTAYCLATASALRSAHESERWLKEALRRAEGEGQPQRAIQAAAAYALVQVTLGAYAQAEIWAGWGLQMAERTGLGHAAHGNTLATACGWAQVLGGRLENPPALDLTHPEMGLVHGDSLLAQGHAEAALAAYNTLDDQWTPIRAWRLPLLARKVRALLELSRLEEAQRVGREALSIGQDTPDAFRHWGEMAHLMPTALAAPSEAVEPLAKLLKSLLARPSAPRAATAALYLASAYLALGLKGKARAALDEAAWALEGLSVEGLAFLAGPAPAFREVFALIRPARQLRLHFLGGGTAWLEGARLALSPRHQEILTALALHPAGLSAERLAIWVWGEGGSAAVARAELQRLRQRLPLESRPYRLAGAVWADFVAVRERLLRGELEAALALYGGPLLPGSEAPGVLEARAELAALLKATLLNHGSPQQNFEMALQEDDPEFWEAALARLPTADPRRALLETRLSRFLESN